MFDDRALGDLTIRQVRHADLELLNRHLPPEHPSSGHDQRIADQDAGDVTYLVAWQRGVPVAHALVRWTGYRTADFAEAFPNCPTLNGVRVWPPTLWNRGIGSAIVAAIEDAVAEKGHQHIGLGVEIDNHRAIAFYERRGYVDWSRGELRLESLMHDKSGTEVSLVEVLTAMTKTLGVVQHVK